MKYGYLSNILNLVHFSLLKRKSFKEIMDIYNLSEKDLCAYISIINAENSQFYPLVREKGNTTIDYARMTFDIHYFDWRRKKLSLMFISDEHIDHIHDRTDYICLAYEEAERRSVDYVFNLGDILNGPGIDISRNSKNAHKYKTGTLEGAMEQLVKFHPRNMPTYFVTGNHDLRHMNRDYVDIGRLIENECPYMVFLNNLFTSISIDGFRINLSHGSIERMPLDKINLKRECPFLTYNDPHVIVQAHFHRFAVSPLTEPILFQLSSIKPHQNPNNYNRFSQAGVLFVTVYKSHNYYNIEYERVCFLEEQSVVKGDKVLTIGMK